MSLLSWERGLKSLIRLVGLVVEVAPLVGAWIEIPFLVFSTFRSGSSLLSWERGLKSWSASVSPTIGEGRSSRGSVD